MEILGKKYDRLWEFFFVFKNFNLYYRKISRYVIIYFYLWIKKINLDNYLDKI